MKIDNKQIQNYLSQLPEDRQQPFAELHKTVVDNIPNGFEVTIKNFINYEVPLTTYPSGYHCTANTPLPFVSIANQKGFIALYHMGIYTNPKLLEWFQAEYPKYSKYKLNMGKSCIRFKNVEAIPYKLIAKLMTKMTVKGWIMTYEEAFKKRS
jgi:hypothetical protein